MSNLLPPQIELFCGDLPALLDNISEQISSMNSIRKSEEHSRNVREKVEEVQNSNLPGQRSQKLDGNSGGDAEMQIYGGGNLLREQEFILLSKNPAFVEERQEIQHEEEGVLDKCYKNAIFTFYLHMQNRTPADKLCFSRIFLHFFSFSLFFSIFNFVSPLFQL